MLHERKRNAPDERIKEEECMSEQAIKRRHGCVRVSGIINHITVELLVYVIETLLEVLKRGAPQHVAMCLC